jgi:hypothetical protein
VPSATIINYLDDHAGAFTALLTLALVLVTSYYAVQNHRMVLEMRRTRNAAVLPKLALEFHRLGPAAMTVEIRNVGPGAALDLDVRVVFEPREGDQAEPEFRWRRNILSPGEQADFMHPGELNDSINTLPATYRAIRLVGSMKDATGATHEVDEAFENLAEWRELLHDAHQRWTEPDAERRLAKALDEKFKQPISDLQRGLQQISQAVSRLAPPDRSDDE